jgi:hypothetical protein
MRSSRSRVSRHQLHGAQHSIQQELSLLFLLSCCGCSSSASCCSCSDLDSEDCLVTSAGAFSAQLLVCRMGWWNHGWLLWQAGSQGSPLLYAHRVAALNNLCCEVRTSPCPWCVCRVEYSPFEFERRVG